MGTTRVRVNTSTAVGGRAWRSGDIVDVADTDIDALAPHISAGVFSVLGDAADPTAASRPAAILGVPDVPDFIAAAASPRPVDHAAGVTVPAADDDDAEQASNDES